MKQFKFLVIIGVTAFMLFFISACNSGENKEAESTATADSIAAAVAATNGPAKVAEPAPAAKPANVLVINHKVANYDKWKSGYDSHDSVRLAYGLHNYVVARGLDDPNMVMVALHMDDAAKAKAFSELPNLKDAMKKFGVLGTPNFSFVDVQMMDTSTNSLPTRLRMTHKVKDWDAWKKEFDSHKQVRMDAGLIDRSLGYSVSDNHMVSIVFAVTDIKKAKAFLSSKDLKDKMTAAGVDGPPTAFFYTIAQKY